MEAMRAAVRRSREMLSAFHETRLAGASTIQKSEFTIQRSIDLLAHIHATRPEQDVPPLSLQPFSKL